VSGLPVERFFSWLVVVWEYIIGRAPHYFCCRLLGFTSIFRQLAKRQIVSFAAAGLTVAVIHTAVVLSLGFFCRVLLLLPSLQPLKYLLLLKLETFLASRSCFRFCSCWCPCCCWLDAILLASLLLFCLLPYCWCPCCCCRLYSC
jgi:hypothetical protein